MRAVESAVERAVLERAVEIVPRNLLASAGQGPPA
jgi:hypothetical protein